MNSGKLFSARSELSQPRGINLWGNEEDLPQGCMQNWRQCTQVHVCLQMLHLKLRGLHVQQRVLLSSVFSKPVAEH